MKISERGQITIPEKLRQEFGLNEKIEVELTATQEGILIRKRVQADHPVDKVYGILKNPSGTDYYLERIRSR